MSFFGFTDSLTLNRKTKRKVPELGGVIHENEIIKSIISKHNISVFSGKKATIENFHSALKSNLIHISTHAYSNTLNTKENFLVLRTKEDIDYFYGFEFQSLDSLSDIIIFSACDTGIGKIEEGEGVSSFSKYLFESGVKTVVSTNWKINDESTSIFFKYFYVNLKSGESISEALTHAKRTLKQNPKYAHPYYWAGFVLEGNPHVYLELEKEDN